MENDAKGAPMPDLSGILSKVMAHPEALSMLSSLLGGGGKPPPKEEHCEKREECDRECECAVVLPEKRCKKDSIREERRRLLLALKPFLSKEKQSAVERMIRMLELTDVIRSVMTEGGGGERV